MKQNPNQLTRILYPATAKHEIRISSKILVQSSSGDQFSIPVELSKQNPDQLTQILYSACYTPKQKHGMKYITDRYAESVHSTTVPIESRHKARQKNDALDSSLVRVS